MGVGSAQQSQHMKVDATMSEKQLNLKKNAKSSTLPVVT